MEFFILLKPPKMKKIVENLVSDKEHMSQIYEEFSIIRRKQTI